MTATYTFDVFSTLDGFGSYNSNGDWGGYWGKQGPEFARPPPRPVRRGAADGPRGQHLPASSCSCWARPPRSAEPTREQRG